jgi:hypothetical protein
MKVKLHEVGGDEQKLVTEAIASNWRERIFKPSEGTS